jgi:hypothetical protein
MRAASSTALRTACPTRRSGLTRRCAIRRSVSAAMPGRNSSCVSNPRKSATRSKSSSCQFRSPRKNWLTQTSLWRHHWAKSVCFIPFFFSSAETFSANNRAALIWGMQILTTVGVSVPLILLSKLVDTELRSQLISAHGVRTESVTRLDLALAGESDESGRDSRGQSGRIVTMAQRRADPWTRERGQD